MQRSTVRFSCGLLTTIALSAGSGWAQAQTDEIAVFDGEIVAPGEVELTVHSNYTPIGRQQPDFQGGVAPNHSFNGTIEWAYSVADFLELGFNLPVYTITNRGTTQFDGGRGRALWVVPHAHEKTFFYGMSVELSANTAHWDTHRLGLELRPIVGWHLGKWDIVFNPIIDTSLNGARNAHFAPAERIAYNWSESWAVALEHYADAGSLGRFGSPNQQSHEVFGVGDYQFDEANSIEFGVGHGITNASDRLILKLIVNHLF